MAAPTLDTSRPNYDGTGKGVDLDQLRDNITWIIAMLAGGVFILPGWATTASGSDLSEPDYIELVNNDSASLKMKFTFTWSSGNLTQIVCQYDKGLGAGYETFDDGTIAISYDGSGNFSGATTS
ncbi:hypothetical protein F3N42_03615 [Marinihelvus fidelis]|uniref:Uncharacterized protein n=1 Tax=Marinihelvus fidelis TaxID=2613842 RepID=A0A5N0TEN9_9GAMM|nr:hypothetical protein [Marinihelvus fidelis]KAA9133450.1 hypothetical protein F3N42_03615 [Marinihelvus fidelis]